MLDGYLERIARVKVGAGAAKVGYPIGIRELSVIRVVELNRSLRRVTLGGEGAVGFESHVPMSTCG